MLFDLLVSSKYFIGDSICVELLDHPVFLIDVDIPVIDAGNL